MKEKKGFVWVTILVTIVAALLTAGVAGSVMGTWFGSLVGLLTTVTILIGVAWTGLIEIPVTQKAVLVFWGKRTRIVLDEGFAWIPPFLTSIMLVDCKRKTRTVSINEVFTPKDQSEIVVTFEITTQPSNLHLYVETEDVYKQLDGMIAEAVRGFAADTNTAPHEWQEAVSMNEKFARMVVARLMGFTIPRYDDATRKGQHKSEEDMSQEEYNKKQKTLARAKALQVGEGELNVPGLGLMVQRFNITKVEPSETLSKALERISQEEQEQKAETVEAETIAKLVIAFLVALGYEPEDMKHPRIRKQALEDEGLTTAEVLRMMRVEREKAQESTQRFSIDTSPAIETAVKKLLGLSKKE